MPDSETIKAISILAAYLGHASMDGNPMYGSWRATEAMYALSELTGIPTDVLYQVIEH